ncbi:MAG: hypothetical protein AAF772_04415 [Acidobacteriota bacterium]
MTATQELNRIHKRYVSVSNKFKASWTFHQFIQGLQKVFTDEGPANYQADFQSAYANLKEVSSNLTESSANSIEPQLERAEKGLETLVRTMLTADAQVTPGMLRQFFQRVKNYDDNILTQLIRFYLAVHTGKRWPQDRLDKVDFLATKLLEDYDDRNDLYSIADATMLRESAEGFWRVSGVPEPEAEHLQDHREQLDQLRREIAAVGSIDELNEARLVQRYRDYKFELGSLYFHPRLLPIILDINVNLKNQIQQLYHKEEQRIVAEYQEVFDLEQAVPVGTKLQAELDDFREDVERFEKQLQGSNVRLGDLARLRDKVKQLIPRLRPSDRDALGSTGPMAIPTGSLSLDAAFEEPAGGGSSAGAGSNTDEIGASPPADYAYVGEQYLAIHEALAMTNVNSDPKRVTIEPEVYSFGLEPRDVIAYRRLQGNVPCDEAVEAFILRAAALRIRIEQEVDEIKGILDDSAITRDAPVFAQAAVTVRLSDLWVRRFDHLIHATLLSDDSTEARSLQVLRMRLTRSYAGLWLLVHKP